MSVDDSSDVIQERSGQTVESLTQSLLKLRSHHETLQNKITKVRQQVSDEIEEKKRVESEKSRLVEIKQQLNEPFAFQPKQKRKPTQNMQKLKQIQEMRRMISRKKEMLKKVEEENAKILEENFN